VENRQKAKLLKKIVDSESLPSLSPIAIQLVELAADDRSSAADLAAIIEKDPSLTTRLLKLVGSALYARPERVRSISQAVVLLGFKKVRIMALSLSLRDTFPMGEHEGMDYNHFWKTSLYRGLIAQDFARSAQPINNLHPEEAFIAALISEIGILMLYRACPEETKKMFPVRTPTLEEAIAWEEENLRVNHREVGSIILRRWRFPDHLVECQKHFGPEILKQDKPILCKTVELARRATEIVFGETPDLYEVQQQAQTVLQLEPEGVNSILSQAFDKVENLAEQLRIQVDSQTDMITVLEKANQALARVNASMEFSLQGLLDHASQHDRVLTSMSEEMARSRRDVLQNTLDAVAHEIRNPLLAIGGFAKRLARQCGGDAQSGQYAEIIAKESRRLEGVLKEIVDYCRDYEPVFVEKDLTPIIDEVLDEFGGLFREKDIDIVRHFPPEPIRVPVDVDGITRVLQQLIKTAIHMIGPGRGTLTVSTRPSRQTGQVSIEISDNASPMPDGVRDALLDSNLSTTTFGEGLGLPMARKIIEAHHGHIELKVQLGRGNTVSLYLPTFQSA
jgi:HD-like signal output (HDOD) protein